MTATLGTWQVAHRAHGLGRGPYYDAKIHVWHVHRCPCGAKLYIPEEQHERGAKAVGEVRE